MDYFGKAATAKERNKEAEQDEKDKLSSYEEELSNYGTWERTGESGKTVTISEDEYNMLKNNASYSTTEQKVGTWINGKTIYRKVIENLKIPNVTKGGTVENSYEMSDYISNSETIISSKILIPDKNKAFQFYMDGAKNYITIMITDSKKIYIRNHWESTASAPSEYENKDCLAIIEYTKTTDTVPNN